MRRVEVAGVLRKIEAEARAEEEEEEEEEKDFAAAEKGVEESVS